MKNTHWNHLTRCKFRIKASAELSGLLKRFKQCKNTVSHKPEDQTLSPISTSFQNT